MLPDWNFRRAPLAGRYRSRYRFWDAGNQLSPGFKVLLTRPAAARYISKSDECEGIGSKRVL
jgi:hypothetical protein